MRLRCGDRVLDLDRTVVMGILNVTPDSFSDGGLWFDRDDAVKRGLQMVEEGAGVVDVGGESTRPDAVPVAEDEELDRIVPVIEGLAAETDVPISIDTRKPRVARKAIQAGACIVNDTAGEIYHRAMDQVAAETGAGIAIMHSRGTPATMRSLTDYRDVVDDVGTFLQRRAEELQRVGVHHDAIAVDPGIGFAKTPAQNLLLLRELRHITALGYPVLVGTSRKSFIGVVLGASEQERVEGTMATIAWAITQGARLVRAHDVTPAFRTVRMTEAIASGGVRLDEAP